MHEFKSLSLRPMDVGTNTMRALTMTSKTATTMRKSGLTTKKNRRRCVIFPKAYFVTVFGTTCKSDACLLTPT